MQPDKQKIIETAYAAFNNRDIDTILALMQPGVHWPKGFEGGFVTGHENVRAYWLRQWAEINPVVVPVALVQRDDDTVAVDVHQVVKSLQGGLLADGMVKHIYTFKGGLIAGMDIETA